MPLYDYDCGQCGSFSDLQPMSRASEAMPCPICGEPADRIVCTPFVANRAPNNRVAHQRSEKSAHEPQVATGPLPGKARGHGHGHHHGHGHSHSHCGGLHHSHGRPWAIGH